MTDRTDEYGNPVRTLLRLEVVSIQKDYGDEIIIYMDPRYMGGSPPHPDKLLAALAIWQLATSMATWFPCPAIYDFQKPTE